MPPLPLGQVLWNSCPDLSDAEEVFKVLRGDSFAGKLGSMLDRSPERLGPEVTWNIEYGRTIDISQVGSSRAWLSLAWCLFR